MPLEPGQKNPRLDEIPCLPFEDVPQDICRHRKAAILFAFLILKKIDNAYPFLRVEIKNGKVFDLNFFLFLMEAKRQGKDD